MKKRRSKSFFKIFCLLAVVSAVMVIGCKKKSPSPTGGQVQQDADFQTSPGVVICDLKKVKLDKMDLPNDQPYFIRDMERNSKDTLLKGELAIEGKEYTVILPYESRWEQMALYETAKKQSPSWWGADDLNSIHKINGKYYEFSTLEGKSKFAARLYAGDTGVFKVGKGGRDLEKAEFSGSVRSKEYAAAVGDVSEGWAKPVAEYVIPVGDYRPAIMDVRYDNLSISISHNYHRDLQGRQMGQREEIYGFQIRQDKSYVLDFSNEPVVIFDTPAPDKNRFKVGEEIKFAAVLVDAELDIMIRGLRDMSVEVEKEFKNPGGETTGTYKQKKSLDPSVVISRADGEVVAEGIMPYG